MLRRFTGVQIFLKKKRYATLQAMAPTNVKIDFSLKKTLCNSTSNGTDQCQNRFFFKKNVMQLYKQWHRPMSKRFIKPPYSKSRATSIDSDCCHLPTTSALSSRADKLRSSQFWSASPNLSRPHIIQKFVKLKYRGPWWLRP